MAAVVSAMKGPRRPLNRCRRGTRGQLTEPVGVRGGARAAVRVVHDRRPE